jgi:phosphatidylserine/phosphatidylglycerophosphate/cardiolipin synthase-like enzyme
LKRLLRSARNLSLHLQPNATTKLWLFKPVQLALAIRLFLSACVAVTALGAAWAEKGSKAVGSQPEVHYAPRENLESVDAQEIGRAQLSIDIAAYVLSDSRIIEALTDAAERGVLIRLYLDKSQFA